jgi:hypothetical protein
VGNFCVGPAPWPPEDPVVLSHENRERP